MKKKDVLIGKNAIIEALTNGISIDAILVNKTSKDIGEIQSLAKERAIPIKRVPIQKIDYLLFPIYQDHKPVHQGVVAILNEIEYHNIDDIYHQKISQGIQPLFVLLDGITDVGNFGAIARSALCFDIDAIIIPNRNSVSVNAQSNKSSAGALSQIPVCRIDSTIETLEYLTQCGMQIVGASEKSGQTMQAIDFSLPTVIVMGREESGISKSVKDMLTHEIKIEMNSEKFDSLNVSVASGILFHHIYHVRHEGR